MKHPYKEPTVSITVRLPKSLHRAVLQHAKERRLVLSEYVRHALDQVAAHVRTPSK